MNNVNKPLDRIASACFILGAAGVPALVLVQIYAGSF